MDEENYYEYDEGSDLDNWEEEQVFQDHEERDEEEWLEQAGEMMMEQMRLPEE